MTYPNFVSEEWSHVLTWDLLVGRFIWQDGIKRGIFTSHSVLLTNLIGPPGLLLHFLTCVLLGKGLPPTDTNILPSDEALQSPSLSLVVPTARADSIIESAFVKLYDENMQGVERLVTYLDDDIVWEDTADKLPTLGIANVKQKLQQRVSKATKTTLVKMEKLAEGVKSSGFTWHLAESGRAGKGLRGTTFVSINDKGKVDYVREVVEPLYKPGKSVSGFLKAVAESGLKKEAEMKKCSVESLIRKPSYDSSTSPLPTAESTAADIVTFLWQKVQGSNKEIALRLFDENILYKDLSFPTPFIGKAEVSDFLDEFDIPGLTFVPERISGEFTL